MTLPEQDRPQDPLIEDNAIHVPNPETARANGTQIAIAALAVVAILFIFFYGVNSQRDETASTAGTTPVAATQQPSSPPAAGKSNVPTTTGQGAPQPRGQ